MLNVFLLLWAIVGMPFIGQARVPCKRTELHSCTKRHSQKISQSIHKPKQYYFKSDRYSRTRMLVQHAANSIAPGESKQHVQYNATDSQCLVGIPVQLQLAENYATPAVFFDRKSDVLLVLGQGLHGSKEGMACFVKLFKQYDIIVFDYRWHVNSGYMFYPNTIAYPFDAMLFDELEEVYAAIHYATSRKAYKQVVGLGECYSAYLFGLAQLYAQKQQSRVFTKLILDSCWLSIPAFIDRITRDPWLLCTNGKGGAPQAISSLCHVTSIRWLATTIAQKSWSDIDSRLVFAQLQDTPLLFIHGQQDKMVPIAHFEELYTTIKQTPKAVIYTPYSHSRNLHDRPFYQYICEQFINRPYEQFIAQLSQRSYADFSSGNNL